MTLLDELWSPWTTRDEVCGQVEVNLDGNKCWEDLKVVLNQIDRDAELQSTQDRPTAEAAVGISLRLTAGTVSWVLRAGSMVASFLAIMPTWRSFDPMTVLDANQKKGKKY